ncbi:MAG: DUF5777 family beta-barrel protein [Flavobacteriales bacterium]
MKRFLFVLLLAAAGVPIRAQDEGEDLLSLLGDEETTDYATASFKTTRIINLHSVEQAAGGVLDFRISHRFGFINTGVYEMFGLDGATIRIGMEYGINDRIMLGAGRSSFNKTYDAFTKVKILRQSSGKRTMPISLSWFSSITVNTLKWQFPERENHFTSRLQYAHQLLIARKFNERLSLQLSPTLIHRNLVSVPEEAHDVIAFGGGGRFKVTKRSSINAEYIYVLPDQLLPMYHNSFSVGMDIETGGHVFQLHCTNSTSMVETGFVSETVGDWMEGDIHFGFNISRVFTVKQRKRPAE